MEEKKNIININGTDYTLKPGMKAVVFFEDFCSKAFEIKNTTDILVYIYAAIYAAKPDMKLDFSDMLEAFDNPELFKQACDIVLPRTSAEKVVQLSKEDGGTEPKKG